MRIIFLDFLDWDYVVESAYRMPLGGSQSALCYVAEALAGLGDDVYLLNHAKTPVASRGVQCLSMATTPLTFLANFDMVVMLNGPVENGASLRKWLRPGAQLILWTQLALDQPMVRAIHDPASAAAFDAVAFVSEWQQRQYRDLTGRALTRVLRNAIAPCFADQFANGKRIGTAKNQPVLAYTSTPFRGLEVLLKVFPGIRARLPQAVLRVYSSMRVYQFDQDKDHEKYGHLYQLCRETPGVEYFGSVPQPVLAEQLADVMVLAYPNHFAETSCIAVMEAMACGCQVVTSHLGALPETTAGFARLVPVPAGNDWSDYAYAFVDQVVEALQAGCAGMAELEEQLVRQVEYVNRHYIWKNRAVEWAAWFRELATAAATRS